MKLPTVPDADRDLVVNETFGPTFQGEGPSTGRYARFIRLFGCHLSCSWCDSAQTHDGSRYDLDAEHQVISVEDVLCWLAAEPRGLVVITGGEPLLQPRVVGTLAHAIRDAGLATDIEIETSGTLAPTPDIVAAVTQFNVSPKLAHSGLHRHQRIRPTVLHQLVTTHKAIWKFVVQDPSDLDEVEDLVSAFGLAPVWVMPEGTDSATVLARMRLLADPVLERGWHLSTRLHTLLWENDRAR
ncbi:MAG: organic radical activating enzyme [Amycolatopsis sp.]|uniref:7-carboxy-7-deazaguanine synthase QueE n=1 Tax=Amycolatopsis sp. TaxID=37632 RepID=UPI00260215BA|nr:7-carboxy-7-deazaguanine synthase QueE [Amycolatopsis sp.]MCU1680259.1 organic radical activating enzyme [Amycolatopsis sp.]